MATIYDRNDVVIGYAKGLLTLKKATEADRRDCPDLVFTHEQARSLWETLAHNDNKDSIVASALQMYGDKINAKGNYPQALIARNVVEKEYDDGVVRTFSAFWTVQELLAFKPVLVQLEVGIHGQPQLCAYLVKPVAKARTGKQRAIPTLKRIDVNSPEGKEIAAQHAPRSQGIRRRG